MSELFDKMPTGMMDDAIEIYNLRAEVSRLTADIERHVQIAADQATEVTRLTAERDALRAALDTFVRIHRVAGTPNAISDADLVVWTQEAIDAARAALKDAP